MPRGVANMNSAPPAGRVFEYACHETATAQTSRDMLAGARADEATAAAKKTAAAAPAPAATPAKKQ